MFHWPGSIGVSQILLSPPAYRLNFLFRGFCSMSWIPDLRIHFDHESYRNRGSRCVYPGPILPSLSFEDRSQSRSLVSPCQKAYEGISIHRVHSRRWGRYRTSTSWLLTFQRSLQRPLEVDGLILRVTSPSSFHALRRPTPPHCPLPRLPPHRVRMRGSPV